MADLEKRIEALEFELERAKAYQECLNTIDKYTYYFNVGMFDEIVALWADRPDSSVEMAWGTYSGTDGIKRCYLGHHGSINMGKNGSFYIHSFATPVLEVAADGKTARAVFFSPGVETPSPARNDGELECLWCWIKYGVDFIKIDGKWYIWHLSTYGWFMCDYYKSWGEESFAGPGDERARTMPREHAPDGPISHEDWIYTPTGNTVLLPVPPLPYKTFKDVGYNLCCPNATYPPIQYDEVTGG